MNDKTYPLGVWEMYDEVKNLGKMEIINECFKKWWKYNEIRDLKEKTNKAIEYCEEITSREIDISDTDYDLGQDFTARDILDILRGDNIVNAEDNEKVKFWLEGCDIQFLAQAPEDITLKQLLKQCNRIIPDWCSCGINNKDIRDYQEVEIDIDYDDIKKMSEDVSCTIEEIDDNE